MNMHLYIEGYILGKKNYMLKVLDRIWKKGYLIWYRQLTSFLENKRRLKTCLNTRFINN